MNVESLKNYGRPLSDTMTTLPSALEKRIRSTGAKVMRKHLGLLGMLRLLLLTWQEKRRMRRIDLAAVRSKGLSNERFIDWMLEQTAMFSATVKMVGMEKALSIHREIMEQVVVPMIEALYPSGADFERLDDPAGAFRQYMLAYYEAEDKAGLYEYRIAEDDDEALAVDVTYCALCEIPKRLGVIEACEPFCYADEVFLPDSLEPFGLRFVRTQTLGRKGEHCDFRFERVSA
jgi:hypothetical protein